MNPPTRFRRYDEPEAIFFPQFVPKHEFLKERTENTEANSFLNLCDLCVPFVVNSYFLTPASRAQRYRRDRRQAADNFTRS